MTWDYSKAYNTVETFAKETHMRRLVWRCSSKDWRTFGITRMHFGVRPAAAGLEVAKGMVAEHRRYIDPETADMLKRGYMDDRIGGGSIATVSRLIGDESYDEDTGHAIYSGTVAQIMELGGFNLKYMIRNGESRPEVL